MDHQDFRVITIGSKDKKLKNVKKEIVKRNVSNNNSIINVNARKLENEDIQLKYVDKEVVKKIIQARTLQKISQQDLANKLNVRKNVITELESGKMLKNNQFISKVKKILRI